MYGINKEMIVYRASLPYMQTAKALARSKQMNDHGPLHAQRVYSISKQLARLFDLSSHEIALLLASALLHDIGMAKDRTDHNLLSAKYVKEMGKKGSLPFDKQEVSVVANLCKWHRGTYDPEATNRAILVRTGLLASLLRLADAMDLDYRRSDDYPQFASLIMAINPEQTEHHLSVRNIIALRLHVNRLQTQVELFVDDIELASLQVIRLIKELTDTPVFWPVQVIPMRSSILPRTGQSSAGKATVFSYCNTHGAIQAAISHHQLVAAGFETDIVWDYRRTGNASYFWKNIFPKWSFKDTNLAIVLDLDIPKEFFSDVIKVVKDNPQCRWVYSSPLERSNAEIQFLIDAGVDLLLADERGLFFGSALDEYSLFWMKIAGLSNYDDPLVTTAGVSLVESEVVLGLRYSLWKLIKEGSEVKDYALVVDRIRNNDFQFFQSLSSEWIKVIASLSPKVERQGQVLLVEDVDLPGRLVYDALYHLIENQGLRVGERNEFNTPFAIYRRRQSDREEVLFLSRFLDRDRAYPVKYFVPNHGSPIGATATIWHAYNDNLAATEAVKTTIDRINKAKLQ
jgi:hypothetical protein